MKKSIRAFAVLLVAVAATIILSALEVLPPALVPIILSWPALLVLGGLKALFLGYYLLAGVVLVVGGYFFVPNVYEVVGVDFPFTSRAWGAMAIGMVVLFGGLLALRWERYFDRFAKLFRSKLSKALASKDVECTFAQVEHTIIERPYEGMSAKVAFGHLTLDMTKTVLPEGESVLELDNAFGLTVVVVPEDWSVRHQMRSVFSRLDDSRLDKPVGGDRYLTIRGASVFGRVQVVSKPVADDSSDQGSGSMERISVKHNNRVVVLSLDELYAIQADGDYVTLLTEQGHFLKEQTMKYFQQALPADRFLRIHRSCIVNLAQIGSVDQRGREAYTVTLKNGTTLRASASGYSELKQRLGL